MKEKRGTRMRVRVLLVAMMFLTAACGMRVSESRLAAARAGQRLSVGGAGSAGTGTDSAADATGAGAGGLAGTSSGTATGAAAGGSGKGAATNPAAAPAGGNGGATDVGVT